MIETVIFDLDGVIIDSEPIHFDIEETIFRELGISVPRAEHDSYVGTAAHNMWTTIVQKYHLDTQPEELVQRARGRYLEYLLQQQGIKPIPGVQKLIHDLYHDQLSLLVASSSHIQIIELVLKRFGLTEYFMGKVSGTELEHSKPHPEIFLLSAAMVPCEAAACVVIEDSENGVRAAKAAGMHCIGYLNPHSGAQNLSKADLVIRSFDEIDAGFVKSMGL